MYRIMLVAAKKEDNMSLYRYLLKGDGSIFEIKPEDYRTTEEQTEEELIIKAKEALDEKVENMLNKEGYAKGDFIIIDEFEYNVFADIVE